MILSLFVPSSSFISEHPLQYLFTVVPYRIWWAVWDKPNQPNGGVEGLLLYFAAWTTRIEWWPATITTTAQLGNDGKYFFQMSMPQGQQWYSGSFFRCRRGSKQHSTCRRHRAELQLNLQLRQVDCASAATFDAGFYCFCPSNSPAHQRRRRLIFHMFWTMAVAGWLFSRFSPGSFSGVHYHFCFWRYATTATTMLAVDACSGSMVMREITPPPVKTRSTLPPAFSKLSGQGAKFFF